ncbi:MAG: hypothetical protein WCI05_04640 [Myxococcales bacterium]
MFWYLVAGEPWCRGDTDEDWHRKGGRRSLRTAAGLHPGYTQDLAILGKLDDVLRGTGDCSGVRTRWGQASRSPRGSVEREACEFSGRVEDVLERKGGTEFKVF